MAILKLLRQAPWSARIGLLIVLAYVFVAIFAPLLAPYGQTQVVGDA